MSYYLGPIISYTSSNTLCNVNYNHSLKCNFAFAICMCRMSTSYSASPFSLIMSCNASRGSFISSVYSNSYSFTYRNINACMT